MGAPPGRTPWAFRVRGTGLALEGLGGSKGPPGLAFMWGFRGKCDESTPALFTGKAWWVREVKANPERQFGLRDSCSEDVLVLLLCGCKPPACQPHTNGHLMGSGAGCQTSPWGRPQPCFGGTNGNIHHLHRFWSCTTVLRQLQQMFTQANRAGGGCRVFLADF